LDRGPIDDGTLPRRRSTGSQSRRIVLDRIAPTALPRSSLVISDEPLNRETNYHTEFVVALHDQPQGGLAMRKRPAEVRTVRDDGFNRRAIGTLGGGQYYNQRQNGGSLSAVVVIRAIALRLMVLLSSSGQSATTHHAATNLGLPFLTAESPHCRHRRLTRKRAEVGGELFGAAQRQREDV